MAVYIAGQIITATIGKHILSKAITESSSGIYSSLSSIYFYSKHTDAIIKELDIKNKLKTIESVCESLNQIDNTKTIETCLESIHGIMLSIKCDLKIINKKLDKHEKKYFNGWRSLNLKHEINQLKLHCGILDKRYELLASTMTILNQQK